MKYLNYILTGVLVAGCGGASKSPKTSGSGDELPGLQGAEQPKLKREVSRAANADFAAAVKFYQDAAAKGWNSASCDAAASRFIDVAKEHQKMVEARFNAGLSYQNCKKMKKAEQQYKAALAIKQTDGRSLANLGQIAFGRGDEASARRYWERAIEADGKIAAARANLAWLILRDLRAKPPRGREFETRFKEASRHLSSVLAVENENIEAYVLYALLYLEGADRNRSRLAIAAIMLDKAQEIDANYAPLHNARGKLLQERDQVAPALAAYRRAVQLDASFIEARMSVGNIVLKFRKYDDAEVEFRAVLDVAPKNYDALVGMGIAKRGLKKLDEAEAHYDKARGVDGNRPEAHFNAGVLYQDFRANATEDLRISKKAYETAIDHFRRAAARAGSRRGLKREAEANIKVCQKNLKLLEEAIQFSKK